MSDNPVGPLPTGYPARLRATAQTLRDLIENDVVECSCPVRSRSVFEPNHYDGCPIPSLEEAADTLEETANAWAELAAEVAAEPPTIAERPSYPPYPTEGRCLVQSCDAPTTRPDDPFCPTCRATFEAAADDQ